MTINYTQRYGPLLSAAADMAGEVTLKYFRKPLPIDVKDDRSPVTQADREIEEKFRAMVRKEFPDHGIIGEEFGRDRPDAEFVWVIDPIDGTRAFMTGKPIFGTVIGLLHEGKPMAGTVDQAFTKERWFGVTNRFAFHNGKPIHIAPPRKLNEARMYIGSPNMFDGPNLEKYLTLCRTARWPQYGCDCYAYGLLAMGWADCVVEQKLALYDVAGLVPIITGAGGFVSDWKLNPVGMDFDGHLVAASSKELAVEVLKIMAP
jgi:histidinol phosphatase-like enzyme (inositol monophosphatase family)